MQKSVIFLIGVGILIVAGVGLSFYGAQLITQDIAVKDRLLSSGGSLEIVTELDSSQSEIGVYVVQIPDFKDEVVVATIFDPSDIQIISNQINANSIEDRFEISSSGTYKLVIEYSGQDEIQVFGGIGHMPDTSTLSIGITGFYIIIVGLIGLVAVGIYAVRNRRKRGFS